MKRTVALGILAAGVVLLVAGLRSSRSAVSQLSEIFNNRPSHDTTLLIAAGLGCVAIGVWSLLKHHDKS